MLELRHLWGGVDDKLACGTLQHVGVALACSGHMSGNSMRFHSLHFLRSFSFFGLSFSGSGISTRIRYDAFSTSECIFLSFVLAQHGGSMVVERKGCEREADAPRVA